MSLPTHTPGGSGYHVVIEDESCQRRAFWCTNGQELIHGRAYRVKRQVRPNVPGKLNNPKFLDDRELDLFFEFDGAYDVDGVAQADREATLNDTLDWFADTIVDAAGDADSKLSVEVVGKGGVEWSGTLVVTDFERGDGLEDCTCSLSILLPDGLLSRTVGS